MISRILFNFNFYKKNIWAKNYMSFPIGKSFLKQMLFHSSYKVSIGFGGTFFSENDIGGTWLNGSTKKFQRGGGGGNLPWIMPWLQYLSPVQHLMWSSLWQKEDRWGLETVVDCCYVELCLKCNRAPRSNSEMHR